MVYISILTTLLINIGLAIVDKQSSTKLTNSFEVFSFSLYKTMLCALFSIVLLPFDNLYINIRGILIALFAGIFHASSVVLIMQCLKCNKTVHVNLFMTSGIILPSIFGWIFWKESITLLKIICLILTVFSLKVMLNVKMDRNKGIKLLLVMFFCFGMLMVMQAMYPKYCVNGSKLLFSAIMYGVSAVILGIIVHSRVKTIQSFDKSANILLITAAIFNLLINILLTSLSGKLDSSVVFPFVHGLKLVALMLLSPTLWKEKLTAQQIISGFVAIVCISLLSI